MAESNVEPMEVSQKEHVNNHKDSTPPISTSVENSAGAVKPADETNPSVSPQGKKELTTEERQERKKFFRQRGRGRFSGVRNYTRGFPRARATAYRPRTGEAPLVKNILACNLSQEEKTMLEFYRVRLSTLRRENDSLHRTLTDLVGENMRLLQSGPPRMVA